MEEGIRDLENLNHPWGGVEGAPRGYPGPSTPPQGGGTGAGCARPRTPTLGCFEISESLSKSDGPVGEPARRFRLSSCKIVGRQSALARAYSPSALLRRPKNPS